MPVLDHLFYEIELISLIKVQDESILVMCAERCLAFVNAQGTGKLWKFNQKRRDWIQDMSLSNFTKKIILPTSCIW